MGTVSLWLLLALAPAPYDPAEDSAPSRPRGGDQVTPTEAPATPSTAPSTAAAPRAPQRPRIDALHAAGFTAGITAVTLAPLWLGLGFCGGGLCIGSAGAVGGIVIGAGAAAAGAALAGAPLDNGILMPVLLSAGIGGVVALAAGVAAVGVGVALGLIVPGAGFVAGAAAAAVIGAVAGLGSAAASGAVVGAMLQNEDLPAQQSSPAMSY